MASTSISYTDRHIFEFTPELDPVYTADKGESLTIETVDSLNGKIQSESDLLESIPEEVNAATGPIKVEDAEPGDILQIKIEDIRVNEDRGRVVTAPGFGLLQNHDDIEHPSTRITPVEDDAIKFEDTKIPIKPVIGTIGVAPAEGSYTTLVPHDHGGNLDTTNMTSGTTAYFPVFQPGAMLALGDAKAAMADGEMCGTGAEIGTNIDITVEVLKDSSIDLKRPLLEMNDSWKTLASAETMEEAAEIANRDAIRLIKQEYDFETTDAYMFSSLVGGLEISQVVDPLVTVRNTIPKEFLPDPL